MTKPIGLNSSGILAFKKMPVIKHGAVDPPHQIKRLKSLMDSLYPRICVIRGEGIGDLLMVTPSLAQIKKIFNGKIHITLATNIAYLDGALEKSVRYNPDIDHIIDRDSYKAEDFDLTLNLHCPCIKHEKPMAKPINRIDLFANYIGITLDDPRPKFYLKKEEIEKAKDTFYSFGLSDKDKVIMLQVFASSDRRSFDSKVLKDSIIELNNSYKIKSLIIRHSSDTQTDILWDNIPGSRVIKDYDTRELAAMMVLCNLVLCPDSSILHIAGALNVPTVSLFAPTDPRARINYYPQAVAIWGGETLGGHPHWYDVCPHKDLCWKMITKESIVNACIKHISKTNKVSIDDIILSNKPQLISSNLL